MPTPAEVERRALALFERLSDPTKSRDRLLAEAPAPVRARLQALEQGATDARRLLATDVGGGLPVTPPDRSDPSA